MSKAPKKADKAKRPSPPDRDGNGEAGGSLAGNDTAVEALGSADHALAEEEIAEEGLATIIIKGATTGKGNSHPLNINGHLRHISTNIEVQVNASELAVIEASHLEYETVVPLPVEPEAPAEEAAEPAAPPEGESGQA